MKKIIIILSLLIPILGKSNDTIKVQKTITFNLSESETYKHVTEWFELNKGTSNDIHLINDGYSKLTGIGTMSYGVNKESIFYWEGNRDRELKTTNRKGFTCFKGNVDYTITVEIKGNKCFVLLCFLNLKTGNPCGFDNFDNCSPTVYQDMELKASSYSNDIFTSLESIHSKSMEKDEFDEYSLIITEITVSNDSFDSIYRRVIHAWGATYYFKDGTPISELTWVTDAEN